MRVHALDEKVNLVVNRGLKIPGSLLLVSGVCFECAGSGLWFLFAGKSRRD